MEIAGLYFFSYLVGAVPTAYLIGRLVKGIDLRQYGSGNLGGTNVAQHVGRGWLVPLVLGEMLVKGATPVWIGQYLLGLDSASVPLVIAPLLAVAGNNWSVFLKLQGGRGIAVAVGSLLALSPLLLGAFVGLAFLGWLATRSAGVWVLVSLVFLPVGSLLLGQPYALAGYCAGLVALVALKRLLSNWTPFPSNVPRKRVLFNRLFRDRDVDDRAEWVQRLP